MNDLVLKVIIQSISQLFYFIHHIAPSQEFKIIAIRSDEVPHAAEVQTLEKGLHRVGKSAIGTWIPAGRRRVHLTEGGLELSGMV